MIVSAPLALKFVSLVDRGDARKERVHLEAIRDTDTAYFVLLATHEVEPGSISAGARPAYWFESTEVKRGDHVIVYTRSGDYIRAQRKDGFKNHFFYWGNTGPLFRDVSSRVVIAEVNSWEGAG
jgi:hypothetical protein